MKNNWTLKVFFLTFILAVIFSLIANYLGKFNNIVLSICIVAIIVIGILFDLIGTAVLSCDMKVLHSRASQKLKGGDPGTSSACPHPKKVIVAQNIPRNYIS